MTDMQDYAQTFDSWRRVLATAQEHQNITARLNIFSNAAHEIAGYIANGLDRAAAADELTAIAEAYGLDADPDAVQWIISNAFDKPGEVPEIKPQPAPVQARKLNGGAAPIVEIPLVYPFPIDGAAIPRRRWLVPGLLMRRQVTVLVAPAGSGKSLLSLQMSLMCSCGVAWNSWRPRGRYRIMVVNGEEDGDEMRRRLFAAREYMNVDERDLAGVAFAENPEDIIVAKADARTKTVTAQPMLERIVATIIAQQMDIVIVDPFAETFVGDENSNSELKWAAVLWRTVARRTNAAVMLIHHTRKYAHEPGDPDVGRGGGSLTGVARIVCTLFSMSKDEAQAFGIDPDERNKYIRIDDAKANLTLVGLTARWLRKEAVTLPNAGDDEPADEVGVLSPWMPPDDILGGMSVNEVRAVLDELRAGTRDDDGNLTGDPYSLKKAAKGSRWAGTVLQRWRDITDEQAKRVLARWIKNGFLTEVETKTSTSHGRLRKGLRVTGGPGVISEDHL